MAFKYEYKSDSELELTYKKLAIGECKFMVKSVTDKDDRGFDLVNSKGNPYLKLELIVIDSKGEKGLVRENISSNAAWKIKELCYSLGVPQFYNDKGEFEPSMIIGLQGALILEDRTYTKNDGTQATISSVASYLVGTPISSDKLSELAASQEMAKLESDVPF